MAHRFGIACGVNASELLIENSTSLTRRGGGSVRITRFRKMGRTSYFRCSWPESGPGARPMEKKWVDGICHQCTDCDVPFFFKQWGGVQKKRAGRKLDGRTYDEMPALHAPVELRVL
jgi:hypothetical protein